MKRTQKSALALAAVLTSPVASSQVSDNVIRIGMLSDMSSLYTDLAGAMKAMVFQLASLTDVHWTMSGEVVLMTLLGGMGTIFGSVAGAFVIVALENHLAGFGQWVTVITGGIFVFCALAFRRGIVGEIAAWRRRGGAA